MRVIIAGTRSVSSRLTLQKAVDESGFPISEVYLTGFVDFDLVIRRWATENNLPVVIPSRSWIEDGDLYFLADAIITIRRGRDKNASDIHAEKMLELKKPVYTLDLKYLRFAGRKKKIDTP